jgi:hypothetical protein
VAVLIVLAWTALDLSNVGVCLLDAVEVRVGGEAVLSSAGPGSTSDAVPPHVDDCFCCSHCVDLPSVGVLNAPIERGEAESARVASPTTTDGTFYHPPKILS